jgi:hypothetical protein
LLKNEIARFVWDKSSIVTFAGHWKLEGLLGRAMASCHGAPLTPCQMRLNGPFRKLNREVKGVLCARTQLAQIRRYDATISVQEGLGKCSTVDADTRSQPSWIVQFEWNVIGVH